MTLLAALIILAVVVVGAYIINTQLTIPAPMKMIFNVIIAIVVLVLILQVTGVLGTLNTPIARV